MKSCVLALSVVLTACSSLSGATGAAQSPRVSECEADETCPRVCWLGINPGVTSIEAAKRLLLASSQIDRARFYKETASGIQTVWKTDESNTYWANVWLTSDGNLVRTIRLGTLAPFKLNDLVVLLGQPDEIAISLDRTVDGGDIVDYALYFSKFKASVGVYPGNPDGPGPSDFVDSLILNSESVDSVYSQSLNNAARQPWLGYGRLEQYLRNNLPPPQ